MQRLLAVCPIGKVPVRVYVRATNIYGAESSGDANIYVNYRTIERVESEDEMAATLAHELAHIVLGHPSADIVQDVQARSLRYTTMALAVHATVARQYGVNQGMGVTRRPWQAGGLPPEIESGRGRTVLGTHARRGGGPARLGSPDPRRLDRAPWRRASKDFTSRRPRISTSAASTMSSRRCSRRSGRSYSKRDTMPWRNESSRCGSTRS